MHSRSRVLLVGGSPDEREMYAEVFRQQGFCTLQASTAIDARKLAVELSPMAVVTGVMLSGSDDGLALTRLLKEDELTRDVPVVVLSGYLLGPEREAAVQAGCDEFVAKPCLPDVLFDVVQELIAARRLETPVLSFPHEQSPAHASK